MGTNSSELCNLMYELLFSMQAFFSIFFYFFYFSYIILCSTDTSQPDFLTQFYANTKKSTVFSVDFCPSYNFKSVMQHVQPRLAVVLDDVVQVYMRCGSNPLQRRDSFRRYIESSTMVRPVLLVFRFS